MHLSKRKRVQIAIRMTMGVLSRAWECDGVVPQDMEERARHMEKSLLAHACGWFLGLAFYAHGLSLYIRVSAHAPCEPQQKRVQWRGACRMS